MPAQTKDDTVCPYCQRNIRPLSVRHDMGDYIFTTDDVRRECVEGANAILEAPRLISRFISEDMKRLVRAQRRYWESASQTELQKLLDILQTQ
jgi:hypothetical protein